MRFQFIKRLVLMQIIKFGAITQLFLSLIKILILPKIKKEH